MSGSALLEVSHVGGSLLSFLQEAGEVIRVFDQQDSGNTSYGVRIGSGTFFVKYGAGSEQAGWLQEAVRFHTDVRHAFIPSLQHSFTVGDDGMALVFEWADGEVLNSPGNLPGSPLRRFCGLPVQRIVDALTAVYEVHAHIEEYGYVAVDFYDGTMIYDFASHQLRFCDFDHYHKGPYVLEKDRQFGSSRFMAPEEWRRGSTIDSRTTVFTMGAAAFVFLADRSRERGDWRATDALYRVASCAASEERSKRFATVKELCEEWKKAEPDAGI